MEKLRYALIGCGRICKNHISAVNSLSDRVMLTALCDLEQCALEKALNMAENNVQNVKTYTDYKAMLANEQLDFIAVATDSGKHAQIALDCMDAGVNVLIEKPIALSIKDADALIKKSEQKGLLLGACHQNRFNKAIAKIRGAVEAGDFGKLFNANAVIRWSRDKNYYDSGAWRGTWEQDGGALMNQCIHNIDLLRWMLGDDIDEVTALTANQNHPYIEGEDFGVAIIKFSNGAIGTVEGSVNIYPNNLEETLSIFGEKGSVRAAGTAVNTIDLWKFQNQDEAYVKNEVCEHPENVYGSGHTLLYRDFVDALINKRPLYVDGYTGKRALELVLAIYKSAKEHKTVKLPLDDFSTLDMKS